MTAEDVAALLPKELCPGLAGGEGPPALATPFLDDANCWMIVYVVTEDGQDYLSDCGTTRFFWGNTDFPDDENLAQFIRRHCELHGVEDHDGAFRRPVTAETAAESFIEMCQALLKLSMYPYVARAREGR